MNEKLDYFKLIRDFWDFTFENPELIKPNHCALYCFIVEHCNRLGWKAKFGFPTEMAKDAIGIKSYNTYINTLNDLVEWGFIKMIEKSKNQYSSNIIALSYFDKALDKALDKAFMKHSTKQGESKGQSIDSIDKQYTNNNNTIEQYYNLSLGNESWINQISIKNEITLEQAKRFLFLFTENLKLQMAKKETLGDYASHFTRWLPIEIKKLKKEADGKEKPTNVIGRQDADTLEHNLQNWDKPTYD